MGKFNGWSVKEANDGWWEVDGEQAPDWVRWRTLPGCLEVAAEEAERLDVSYDMKVEVQAEPPWITTIGDVIRDYGLER